MIILTNSKVRISKMSTACLCDIERQRVSQTWNIEFAIQSDRQQQGMTSQTLHVVIENVKLKSAIKVPSIQNQWSWRAKKKLVGAGCWITAVWMELFQVDMCQMQQKTKWNATLSLRGWWRRARQTVCNTWRMSHAPTNRIFSASGAAMKKEKCGRMGNPEFSNARSGKIWMEANRANQKGSIPNSNLALPTSCLPLDLVIFKERIKKKEKNSSCDLGEKSLAALSSCKTFPHLFVANPTPAWSPTFGSSQDLPLPIKYCSQRDWSLWKRQMKFAAGSLQLGSLNKLVCQKQPQS